MRHRRLDVIGETRWWAKDEALRKVFGSFAKPDLALYTDVVITMERIEKDVTIKPAIRSKAQTTLLSGPMAFWKSSRTVMPKLRLLSQRREQKKRRENQVSWQKTSPLLMQTWITTSRSTMWLLDTVVERIHHCYAANSVLCADVSCMNPKCFPEIREKGLPKTAMKELSKCFLDFDEHATVEALQAELISLAQQ